MKHGINDIWIKKIPFKKSNICLVFCFRNTNMKIFDSQVILYKHKYIQDGKRANTDMNIFGLKEDWDYKYQYLEIIGF